MPPRRSKKAPQTPPLEGCRIAVSGTFPGQSQSGILSKATDLGSTTGSSVTQDTTHLITTQNDFNKPSTKVTNAKSLNIHIVNLQWLEDTQNANAKQDEQKYSFVTPPAVAVANGSTSKSNNALSKPDATLKRTASAVGDPTTTNLPLNPKRKKGKASDDLVQDQTPKDDQSSAAETKEGKPAPVMGAGQVAKNQNMTIPLDEGCPFGAHTVYIDPNGVIFDASLNQTNSSNNNNKFYRIQLLHQSNSNWKVWTRWGRVGDFGQTKVLDAGSVDDGIRQFDSKFKSKSGLSWENRGDKPKPKNYTFIEKSYAVESDDEDEDSGTGKKDVAAKPPAESKLLPAVQQLMQLIFNQQFFAAAMQELNYDANKLPLGKLSKATITRGFQALKDLSALIDDPAMAATHDMPYNEAVEFLSNSYYSFIPHAFGRNRPPVIMSQDLLKREIELLESLSDMKDAALIMKTDKSADDGIHALDKQFNGLGLQEMTPLDPTSTEFTQLSDYLMNTRGSTHVANYKVEGIFRIERNGERDRFDQSIFAGPPKDRRLLWHGSRCTNFGGILSQGLRIAPPEAPVSGYMFGKGVYLADMSSKSANYCCSYLSDRTALLLLCEAELGDPMQKLTDSSYAAGETAKQNGMHSTWGQGRTGPSLWKDAGSVHPSLAGIKIPDTTVLPGDTNVAGAYLLYNEYICYDVAQIRLRYLFRVRM